MDELRAQFGRKWGRGRRERVNPSADSIATFEHEHACAVLRRFLCRGKPGGAGANHDDVDTRSQDLKVEGGMRCS